MAVQTPQGFLSQTLGGHWVGNTWVQVSLLQLFSELLMAALHGIHA